MKAEEKKRLEVDKVLINMIKPVFHRKETDGSAAFLGDTGESRIRTVMGSTRPNLQDTHPGSGIPRPYGSERTLRQCAANTNKILYKRVISKYILTRPV